MSRDAQCCTSRLNLARAKHDGKGSRNRWNAFGRYDVRNIHVRWGLVVCASPVNGRYLTTGSRVNYKVRCSGELELRESLALGEQGKAMLSAAPVEAVL